MIIFGRFASRTGAVLGVLLAVCATSLDSASAVSNPVRAYPNVVYGQSAAGPLRADIYAPSAEARPNPILIMAHGGGFTSGDKRGTDQYAAAMASAGFVTVNVNYTLAGPRRRGYPLQVREIQRAIRWGIAHGGQYGGDPHRLALVGFSAGGYLVAMAGLLESDLPGRPVKAVVTLSAPLDLPALDRLLRTRLATCGYQPSCPQVPQAPRLSAFGTLFGFLGCSKGNCSSQLIREASPSSHVTANSPPFLIFNSADELIPRSQATDMGRVLRSDQVPKQVVIVPGHSHGASYLPDVGTAMLKFLDQRLGLPRLRLAPFSTPAHSSRSTLAVLAVLCTAVVAGSCGVIMLALRRRGTGHR